MRSPIAVTAASSLPSRSKSANTAPRCSRGVRNSFPTKSETSANFPAAFRKMRLGCASFASNPPPATNKSGQPSLSKSTSPQPQPLHGRLRASSPVDALPSSKEPPPRFRNTSYVSFFSPVITRSSRPSPSTRSEEHTSELQLRLHLVCRLLLEKKK